MSYFTTWLNPMFLADITSRSLKLAREVNLICLPSAAKVGLGGRVCPAKDRSSERLPRRAWDSAGVSFSGFILPGANYPLASYF